MNYADVNGDGEVTPGEIIEENNYYPFGLKHQGYNELAGDVHKYKFLNREHQPELGLNTIATDYRHYDAALGRFNNMDALSELAPNQTPYRYGFNNPVYWTDPTGLFEDPAAAKAYAIDELELNEGEYSIEAYEHGGYVLHVNAGEFDGRSFYYETLQGIDELVLESSRGGSGGDQSGEGEGVNWAQVNHGVNVFGVANGVKTGLIDMAAEAGELSKGTQNYLKTFKVAGRAAGVFGIGYTIYEIGDGEKNLIGEGGLDLIMGGIGLTGWGAPISLIYFGGKMALEATGNDFWNN